MLKHEAHEGIMLCCLRDYFNHVCEFCDVMFRVPLQAVFSKTKMTRVTVLAGKITCNMTMGSIMVLVH